VQIETQKSVALRKHFFNNKTAETGDGDMTSWTGRLSIIQQLGLFWQKQDYFNLSTPFCASY